MFDDVGPEQDQSPGDRQRITHIYCKSFSFSEDQTFLAGLQGVNVNSGGCTHLQTFTKNTD